MKKQLLLFATLLATMHISAQEATYTLDLSDNEFVFNSDEVWDGIFSNDALHADGFVFSHSAPYGAGYYEGFTVSRNSDNANWYDAAGWSSNQWGCMAQGGVDSNSGNGVIGKPFLINYYSSYALSTSEYGASYITLEDNGQKFLAQGIYVCNHPWGYYGCISGDGFATPLIENGGYYKVTFNGVNIDENTTKSIDFYLAERKYSDRNNDGVIDEQDNYTNDSWTWCDLTELGVVDLIYITMDSSDKGDYGMNTATITCLDGLKVTIPNAIETPTHNNQLYSANGNLYISLEDEQDVTLYSITGSMVESYKLPVGRHILNIRHLNKGIYIVQCNGNAFKIIL